MPLFSTRMNIYARAGSRQRGLRSKDLEGHTVGVQRDYEYGEAFDVNTRIRRRVVDKNEYGFRIADGRPHRVHGGRRTHRQRPVSQQAE
ncbi:hypothetical protein [Massilia eburnea]|uniref:hypothetical protein n=1 Tax=Massilia eburnea TaxID=1776165 RepID=UPI003D6BEA2A